jgi:hypothetical protein
MKKEIKKEKLNNSLAKQPCHGTIIYKCEKCGYESPKTFLNIFQDKEYRYCLKCVSEFYESNFPKAIEK